MRYIISLTIFLFFTLGHSSAQDLQTNPSYDINSDGPVTAKSFISFATRKICLEAARNDVTVSGQFELYGGTGRLVELKPKKTWENANIINGWQTVSLAKSQLYEMRDGACYLRSTNKKPWKRRDEVIELISTAPAEYKQIYSGPNQTQTAQRDIFCRDYSNDRAAVITITTINKENISSKKPNFQMTVRRFDQSCGFDNLNVQIKS